MSDQSNDRTPTTDSNSNQQQAAKKNPGCAIVIAMIVFLIAYGIGGNSCAKGLRDSSSNDAAGETRTRSDSATEVKTVDCYAIETWAFGGDSMFVVPNRKSQASVYYCRLYTDAGHSEGLSTYLSISKTDFERCFGPDAGGAGTAGTAYGDYDDDSLSSVFGRSYTAPVRIRAEVVNETLHLYNTTDSYIDIVIPLSFVSVEASS